MDSGQFNVVVHRDAVQSRLCRRAVIAAAGAALLLAAVCVGSATTSANSLLGWGVGYGITSWATPGVAPSVAYPANSWGSVYPAPAIAQQRLAYAPGTFGQPLVVQQQPMAYRTSFPSVMQAPQAAVQLAPQPTVQMVAPQPAVQMVAPQQTRYVINYQPNSAARVVTIPQQPLMYAQPRAITVSVNTQKDSAEEKPSEEEPKEENVAKEEEEEVEKAREEGEEQGKEEGQEEGREEAEQEEGEKDAEQKAREEGEEQGRAEGEAEGREEVEREDGAAASTTTQSGAAEGSGNAAAAGAEAGAAGAGGGEAATAAKAVAGTESLAAVARKRMVKLCGSALEVPYSGPAGPCVKATAVAKQAGLSRVDTASLEALSDGVPGADRLPQGLRQRLGLERRTH
jgi:hypothetical protein